MPDSRTKEILAGWRDVAYAAALPAEAPRPTRSAYPAGIALAAVATLVLVVVFSTQGHGANPGAATGGGSGSAPLAAPATAATAVAAPSSTEQAPASKIPSPGGTCSADQFVQGEAWGATGYAELGRMLVFTYQPLQNRGGDCVLRLPGMIGVASAIGPFHNVPVIDSGTATSWEVKAGQSLSIVLGDDWWTGIRSATGATAFPPPSCADPVHDVARVAFPLASSSIEIKLFTVWREVCSSPASVSLTVRSD